MTKRFFVSVVAGILLACGVSVLLSFAEAAMLLLTDMEENAITYLNQGNKALSVLAGVLLLRRRAEEKELLFGLFVGAGYICLGAGIFCAFAGRLLPLSVVGLELLFGLLCGGIAGFLAGHLPEKREKTRKRHTIRQHREKYAAK